MKITDEKPMVVELLFRSDDDNVDVDENDVDVSPEETKVFTDDGRLRIRGTTFRCIVA